MPVPPELSRVFEKDMKVGDEMIVMGSHVRIEQIELVIHVKVLDDTRFTTRSMRVYIPMTDFNNPFPYEMT